MAYIVPRKDGRWEVRESRTTPNGPRSRTLATFATLTPEIVERAGEHAARPLRAEDLRRAAARAGAPVAPSPPDRAAGELLAELARGRRPRTALRELLRDALQDEDDGRAPSDNARAAGAWVAASAAERGEALRDLLLLSDRLPARRAASRSRFPRLQTAAA
jgi:hypothetical protein